MGSRLGRHFSVTVFGESHGPAIGCTIEGIPPGFPIDFDALYRFMARRAPGSSPLATARKEKDLPVFVAGIHEGKTTGFPCTALIYNEDQRSKDYTGLNQRPRPGHADYTAHIKYKGHADMRGGGHFSGRLTAPLCIAGGLALQILADKGIHLGSHLLSLGPVWDRPFTGSPEDLAILRTAPFPTLTKAKGEAMAEAITQAKAKQDSIGGRIEAMVLGLPPGLGGPMFDGMENRISQALFGIPGIKGIGFGAGFAAADMKGSDHNDPFTYNEGQVQTMSNHAGGILGGITTGMPLVLTVAIKPTPSIGLAQATVDLALGADATLTVQGRHDPCIALRALPVVEAVLALVLLDTLLEEATPFDY